MKFIRTLYGLAFWAVLLGSPLQAERIQITEHNISNFLFLGGSLNLACSQEGAYLGKLSDRHLSAGVFFTRLNAAKKIKSLKKKVAALKNTLKGLPRADRRRQKLSAQLKKFRTQISDVRSGVKVCKEDPFIEHFDNTNRISARDNSTLDGQSHIIPQQISTGQEVVSDSSTKLLLHLNHDAQLGENNMFLHDYSSAANTVHLNGASYQAANGIPNHSGYILFDDPAEAVLIQNFQNVIERSNGLTIAAWVRNENFAQNNDAYVFEFTGTKHIRFLAGSGTLRVCHDSSHCRSYPNLVPDNNWHHLALSISGSVWSLYVDGELKGTMDYGMSLMNFPESFDLRFGGTMQYGAINMSLDEAAVWNTALTAEQISGLYQGRRLTGSFQSTIISSSRAAFYVTASWEQTGYFLHTQISGDGSHWCDVSNGGTVGYFDCGLPSKSLRYRADFVGEASVDKLTLRWQTLAAPCLDEDGDGFDNSDGSDRYCLDDGRAKDCDDHNAHAYPGSQNKFCNCNEKDRRPRQQYESYFKGYCRDRIDNDCDGLTDYDDPDCAEDPESWENLNLKFTGIDISIKGSKFHDYAYERLWYDQKSDDDVVVYMKSAKNSLRFSHNDDNLKGGGLLAYTASLKDRDIGRGLQSLESIRVEVKKAVRAAKNYELNFNIRVSERPGSFDLVVDDLDTPSEDEHLNGLTLNNLDQANSALVDLIYTGSSSKQEINLPRAQEQRIHSGDILFRIDGDEFRNSQRYDYASTAGDGGNSGQPSPTSPIFDAMLADPQLGFFRYSAPFSLSSFKGHVGDNGKPLYDQDRFNYGMLDSFGDEWHTITFWDNDWATNWDVDRRDDASSDGKIIYVVLDPKTPAISFEAPEGEQFYTTPPKTYYTSHIFEQTTFLTAGVQIALHNITDSDDIYYRLDNGTWQKYSAKLTASALFARDDTLYGFQYKIGKDGPVKVRKIHYRPAQPAQSEMHPKLQFPDMDALAAERRLVHGENTKRTTEYEHHKRYYIDPNTTDFRQGTRSLGYSSPNAYFYQNKSLAEVAKDFAYYGAIENNDTYFKKAKEALLFFYTMDPIACEGGKGRMGGPSQERCMYSDARVVLSLPAAYDLLFPYTQENGYEHGMTAIEHIKIRDNLASEAAILSKYPETWATNFWETRHLIDNSVRDVQLEATTALIAMGLPSYDTAYYGTSGADGNTPATHLYAPLPDAPLAWSALHFNGTVTHPTNPSLFRDSAVKGVYEPNGAFVGGTGKGYDEMMYQDIIPFMVYRKNFDGHHYSEFENNIKLEIIGRSPRNAERQPDFSVETSLGRAFMLYDIGRLINRDFPDAGLYLWAKLNPTPLTTSLDYLIDDSTAAEPPPPSGLMTTNNVVFCSDFTDPQAVFVRSGVLKSLVVHSSGTGIQYLAGDLILEAYGERLAIELAGYGEENWDRLSIQNVVELDDHNDYSASQVRGAFEGGHQNSHLDYARMKTDLSITPAQSSFKANNVNQTRHIFFLEKKLVILADQMRSGTGSHDYDFVLHGATGGAAGAFTKDINNDFARWTKPSGVKLLVQFGSDVSLDPSNLTAHDYIEDHDEPYISARLHGSDVDFLTALYPLAAAAQAPSITRFNGSGYDALEIEGEDGHFIAISNRTGQLVNYAGLETDGAVLIVKLDGLNQVAWYGLISGRRIVYQGNSVLNAIVLGDYF